MNGDKFFDFLRASVIPNMMAFNGINPRSIVIMENCSLHHVEVTKLLRQAGIVLFLPPYIPDLNPIKETFGYTKGYSRKHDELFQSIPSPRNVIKMASDSINTVRHGFQI